MSINYVENRNGNREIKWGGLLSFLLLCMLVPLGIAYGLSSVIAPDAETAKHIALLFGVITGVFVFTFNLTLSLRMPIDQLPKSNDV